MDDLPPDEHALQSSFRPTIFHDNWWLSIVTEGQYREALVENNGEVIGRMPYHITRRHGLQVCDMPPFTRVLGPLVKIAAGKPELNRMRQMRLYRQLIGQLPGVSDFRQVFTTDIDSALAFQEAGYMVNLNYTLSIAAGRSPAELLAGFQDKTRNLIRRAEDRCIIRDVGEVGEFIRFYKDNLAERGIVNTLDFSCFAALYQACRNRDCGRLLGAFDRNGEPLAMVFYVWGHGTMYYLLSTRSYRRADNTAVTGLLWEGIQEASRRKLIFDFDGVSNSARLKFMIGFGGDLAQRLIAKKRSKSYSFLSNLKDILVKEDSEKYFN